LSKTGLGILYPLCTKPTSMMKCGQGVVCVEGGGWTIFHHFGEYWQVKKREALELRQDMTIKQRNIEVEAYRQTLLHHSQLSANSYEENTTQQLTQFISP